MTVRAKRSSHRSTPSGAQKNSVGQLWDVLATWRAKATSTVTGHSLDCGHFLQEERPDETLDELQRFFGTP
jgi:haloacetate dehalogenase